MMKLYNRTLEEWIAVGRANGTITNPLTLIGAYCLDLHNARRMIADIATAHVTEGEALRIIALHHTAMGNTATADCDWCEMVRTYQRVVATP